MVAGIAAAGGTTQLLQMAANPHGRAHHMNATQRMQPNMNGPQVRQASFQKQPMTIRYKQYQTLPRHGNASYPILHMNGLV